MGYWILQAQTLLLRGWTHLLCEQRGSIGRSLTAFLAALVVLAVLAAIFWDDIENFWRMITEPIGSGGLVNSDSIGL